MFEELTVLQWEDSQYLHVWCYTSPQNYAAACLIKETYLRIVR